MTNAIEIEGLRKKQGTFLLDGVTFSVPTGHIAGFVGPNGAGKTTTIRSLLGLVEPDAGSIRVLGERPGALDVKGRIGVVLDSPIVAPEWKAGGIGRRIGPFWPTWDEDEYLRLIDRFGIPRESRSATLSRGQAVKLNVAMALAHRPDLLIFDEPSTGLDPVARADLADLLREFVVDGSHSVLFSTHITAELDGVADYINVIVGGRLVWSGELETLHQEFAVARGVGTPPPAPSGMTGLSDEGGRWQALIRSADTPVFPSDVVIDSATVDDIVVFMAREGSREAVSA